MGPIVKPTKGIPNINFEREVYNNTYELISETEYHIRQIENTKDNLESFKFSKKVINASLLIMLLLFLTGVIYPLGMMPYIEDLDYQFSEITL